MKRPFVWICIFYVTGIWIGQSNQIVLFLPVVILSLWLLLRYRHLLSVLFPLICLLGFQMYGLHTLPKQAELDALAKEEAHVNVLGIVEQVGQTQTGRQKILLKCSQIVSGQLAVEDTLYIQIILEEGESVLYRQEIIAGGQLLAPDFQRNPGGFNEAAYFQTQHIDYKMYGQVIEWGEVQKTPLYYIGVIRQELMNVYNLSLPEKEAGLLQAMLLGETSQVERESRLLYEQAGISHIIAISGLHVSVVSFFVFAICRKCGMKKSKAAAVTLLFLIFYVFLTGASLSTVRAVIMTGIVLMGYIVRKQPDIFTSVAVSAFCILIVNPLALFRAGFLLSYGAVLGLVLFGQIVGKVKYAKVLGLFTNTLAASLFTYPIVAYFFYYIPVAGIFANLFVLPFVSILVAAGFVTGVVGLVFLPAAQFSSGILYVILRFYEAVCQFFLQFPGATFITGQPSLWLIAGYYSLLFFCMYLFQKIKQSPKLYLYIAAVFNFIFWILLLPGFFMPKTEVVFLDVGQGDSAVIHYDKQTFLIDGGGWYNRDFGANTGSSVIGPYLMSRGVRKLDGVLITHFDRDHCLGAIEILDLYPVEVVCIPYGNYEDDEWFQILTEKCQANNVSLVSYGEGITIEQAGLVMEFYHPPQNISETEDLNDTSLVVMVTLEGTKYLFTGDAPQAVEDSLVERHLVQADVLKVSHHGSRTGSSPFFVQSVMPEAAVVSAGVQNSYGHPHQEVLDTFDALDIPVYNTANKGAILFIHKEGQVMMETMIERNRYERLKK